MALKYNGPVSETRAGVVEDKFSYTFVVRVGDFPGITPSELSQAVFETIKQYQSEPPESDAKPSKAEAKQAGGHASQGGGQASQGGQAGGQFKPAAPLPPPPVLPATPPPQVVCVSLFLFVFFFDQIVLLG
jgi:hypothetical protein